MGFYHARRVHQEGDKERREDKSRIEHLHEAGVEPEFSPLLGADHLLDALKELRFAPDAGFGPRPLNFREIRAYRLETLAFHEPWESRALGAMSRAYLEGLSLGENPFARLPWHEEDNDGL